MHARASHHHHTASGGGVCGELTLGNEKERVCSCQLGKLITHDGWAYGVESQNIVDIPHLVSGIDITLYSPVKLLRAAIHRRTYPSLTPQPNSTVKWRQELTIPLRLPWEELWPVIGSAQVSGQVRSLLYFLMHRALPLLSRPWISSHFDLPDVCLLCGEGSETYTHLFASCPQVREVWACATLLLESLSLSCLPPLHDTGCLLGLPIYHHTHTPLLGLSQTPPVLDRWASGWLRRGLRCVGLQSMQYGLNVTASCGPPPPGHLPRPSVSWGISGGTSD